MRYRLATFVGVALAAAAPASAQLQPPVFLEQVSTVTGYVYDLDLGDVNGDGLLDLGALSSPQHYEVHFGLGDGSFLPGIPHSLIASSGIWSTTLADATGDGLADLLVVGPMAVYLEQSNGDGTFLPLGQYSHFSGDGNEVIVVDMNHDGIRDLVIVAGDWFPGGVTVWLGVGGGVFDSKYQLPANPYMDAPYTVEAADIHGDGHLDLVCRDYVNKISVVRGQGDGTLQPAAPISLSSGTSATFADLDVDGLPDVVTTSGMQLKACLNQGDGTFAPPLLSTGATATYHVPIDDLNGDGLPDAALVVAGVLSVSLGRGDGTFEDPLATPMAGWPSLVRTADLDRNGSADLIALDYVAHTVSALVNQLPAWPWKLVGTGLAGVGGVPRLHGAGSLLAGSPFAVTLSHALPDAPAFLVGGTTAVSAPFKGGVLLPLPSRIWPLLTDGNGQATLTGTTPTGWPSHTTFQLQAWIPDAGPQGFAATNGLSGTIR